MKGYKSIYGYQISRYMYFEEILNGKAFAAFCRKENLIEDHTACRRGYIPHPKGRDVYHVYRYKKGEFDGYAVLSPLITSNGKLSTNYVQITYYKKEV